MTERTCPTCWAALPRTATRCPVCHCATDPQPLPPRPGRRASLAKGAITKGDPAPGGREKESSARIWPPTRQGLFVASVVALGVGATITILLALGPHSGSSAEAGTFAGNTGVLFPIDHSPSRAIRALDTFVPAGDAEELKHAILNATGNMSPQANYPTGTRLSARIQPNGSAEVVVAIPVNVSRLVRKGWAVTGAEPEASILSKGQVTVNAPDANQYIIRYSPKTRVAVFQFHVSAGDTSISPDNLNAMQVTSQTRSLG